MKMNFYNLKFVREKTMFLFLLLVSTGLWAQVSKIKAVKDPLGIDQFQGWLKKNAGLQQDVRLKLVKTHADKLGFTHYKYTQTIKGIDVFGSEIIAHVKDGKVNSYNGRIVNKKFVFSDNKILLTPEQAIEKGKQISKGKIFKWEQDSSCYPQPALIYIKPNLKLSAPAYVLAYKMDVYALTPLYRAYLYIDAKTGNLILEDKIIKHLSATANVTTAYSGQQQISTSQASLTDSYELKNEDLGGGIYTYDLHNDTDFKNGIIPKDANNTWLYTSIVDKAILDVHFGAEKTYSYYLSIHGRNSIDGENMPIKSYVHYDKALSNAFWDGEVMAYGDGDGIKFNPLTCIDIVGHELTHGVTAFTANLVYANESGALNESFSDIFGACVEYYTKPNNFSWSLGNEISIDGEPMRNMANPNEQLNPDTYKGEYWDEAEEVHTNSGVQNFWFYLLTEGGQGTNDNGDDYNVTGLGFQKSEAIAYRALSVYLTQNSNYEEAREASIQSAEDLYGDCSDEVESVTNAWYAVGVGDAYIDGVKANFAANKFFSCSTPAEIVFNNKSSNSSSFIWDFGDGNTSTDENPTHTYVNAGNYSVQLIAMANPACGNNENDTLLKSDYILIDNSLSMTKANCSPQPNPANVIFASFFGITKFDFNTISNASGGSENGYEDFTCKELTTVTEGVMVPFSVVEKGTQLGESANANVKIWIDLNNDGNFTPDEVIYSGAKKKEHSGNIIIPKGKIYDVPLRLRVISELGLNIIDGCYESYGGQAEDYSVIIKQNNNAPIADFNANKVKIPKGGFIKFSDLSLNLPSNHYWTFEGGSPVTSVSKNPGVIYQNPGTYNAKLKVTNAYGFDSLIKEMYIEVLDMDILCQANFSSKKSGRVVNPEFSESEIYECSYLVSPGDCFDTLDIMVNTLHLDSTQSQIISIYDGVDASGDLLLQYWPSFDKKDTIAKLSLVAVSGSFFIDFSSQGTSSGTIDISWNARSSKVIPGTITLNPGTLYTGDKINFQYSDKMESYEWDFNDGTLSSSATPLHIYAAAGNYTVSLTATNPNGCPITTTRKITLISNPAGVSELSTVEVKVWPNPTTGITNIEMDKNGTFSKIVVYSVFGEMVYSANLPANDVNTFSLNHLADGMYYITLSNDSETKILPLIIQK